MKFLIGIIFNLMIINSSFSQSFDSGSPSNWNDLIGTKYNGSDADLSGFKITQPETSCDSLLRKCAVVWSNSQERRKSNCKKNCDQRLKEYEIYFEVIDRKGNKIISKNVKWNVDVITAKKGFVAANKRFIELGNNIKLDYSTVNYWVQGIKWENHSPRQVQDDGRKAFTMEDIIKSSKAQAEKEAQDAQQEESQH